LNWSDRLVNVKIAASEFKARCLAILDRVHDTGEPVTITKRGRVVATLQPAGDQDEKPWVRLRGTIRKYREPFRPAVKASEWDALK
jgi:prevent-host-death family protein